LILLASATVALGWLLPSLAARWGAARDYSFQLDAEEGFVLEHAVALARGESMYRPIDREPYIVGSYPPLFAWTLGIVNGPAVDLKSMGRGRMLTIAATLGTGLLLALMVALRTRRVLPAVLAPLLFLISYEVYQWSAFVRVDLPALFVSLAGVAVFLAAARRWMLAASALLFVAAVYTKQTAVLAPLACALALARHDRRGLAWFAGVGLGAGAIIFIILQARTDGEFFPHAIAYNRNRMDWIGWRRLMENEIWFFHRWLLLAVVGAAAARLMLRCPVANEPSPAARRRERPHARGTVEIYTFLATLSLLSYAKVGAAPNYVLEPLAAWALFVSESLGRLMERLAGRPDWRARLAVWGVAGLLLIHGLYANLNRDGGPPYVLRSPTPNAAWNAGAREVLLAARQSRGDVFSEEAVFPLLAGKRVVWQSFIMSQLAREGLAGDAPMVEMLRERRLGLFIATADLSPADAAQTHYDRYTPAVVEALQANYRLDRTIPIPTKTYYLWVPRE
jgi:uncharacterized membrane protein (UPF0136 family)